MINAVHHIALIISKEEYLEFYRLLGFTEVFRKERSYDTVVLMDGDDAFKDYAKKTGLDEKKPAVPEPPVPEKKPLKK